MATWFVLGALLGQDAGGAEELQNQLVRLAGLVALSVSTGVEVGLAVKKARSAEQAASQPVLRRRGRVWGLLGP